MSKNAMGWIIAIFILAPLSVFLINKLFFSSQNKNTDEAAKRYIENSIEIDLKVSETYFNMNISHISTGISPLGNRAKVNSTFYFEDIFLDQKGHRKYFKLFFLGNPEMLHRKCRDKDYCCYCK